MEEFLFDYVIKKNPAKTISYEINMFFVYVIKDIYKKILTKIITLQLNMLTSI